MAQKDLRMKGDYDQLAGDYENRLIFRNTRLTIVYSHFGEDYISRRFRKVPQVVQVCRNTKECKRWKTMSTLFYSILCKKFSICSRVVGEGGRR